MPEQINDNSIRLFAAKKTIYPLAVQGTFRKLRWIVMGVLLGIYYAAPWLRWERGGSIPDQAILIDMPHRKAYFFFIEIWPQEVYYLTGILVLAAIGLFCVTSMLGRVWCGYACPQTVWTDLFLLVARFFQGDRHQQMKLDQSPWGFNKLWRKVATHATWLLIALLTGGAWVFYFNDAPTLFEDIIHLDVSKAVMGWVLALTASTYIMAGFAREQVCMYMCPYARFQSAMFDKDTLVISYDERRGEARGHHKKGETWEGRGHCIDCTRCVQVCPQGIDIRNGLQMECIACGLCIDACDDVMTKLELPKGLIRYDTARNIEHPKDEHKFRLLRPRTIYYAFILSCVSGLMIFGLATRDMLELHVLHDRNPLSVMLADGSYRNGYTINVLNKEHQDKSFRIELKDFPAAKAVVQGVGDKRIDTLDVFADSVGQFRVFVTAPVQQVERIPIVFVLKDENGAVLVDQKSIFISKK